MTHREQGSDSWQLGYASGKLAYEQSPDKRTTLGKLQGSANVAWMKASKSMTVDKDLFCGGYFQGWEHSRKGQSNV